MSWPYIIAIGYLVVCWAGTVLVMNSWCPEEDESESGAAYRQALSKYAVGIRVVLVIETIFLGPLLPLFLVYCCVNGWREHRAWRKFARTHREVTFDRRHVANMPRAAQDHIERHEPILQEFGFSPEGSYLLKPEPLPIYTKYFISQEGEAVVDVSLIGDSTSYSFTSILENGHVLQTACAEAIAPMDDFNESGRFTGHMVARNSDQDCVSTLYQRHRETLSELEREFGCETLHFRMDQVQAVMRYVNLVFGEVKFALGKLNAPPPPSVCPDGRAKSVSQRQAAIPAQTTTGRGQEVALGSR